MLRRHHGGNGDLTHWWWDQFQATEAWLSTAAELGALTETPPGKAAQLAEAVTADMNRCWPVELLIHGGYTGHSEEVLGACVDQLNDGAADVVEFNLETPLGKLVDAALAAQLRPRPATSGDRRGLRTRHRASRGRTLLADYLNRTDPIRARLPPTATGANWLERLSQVHALWGDGWVLRQAVALAPISVDLATLGAPAPPGLARVLQQEAGRRANRANPEWWRHDWETIETPLARRCWLFSIVTVPQTRVVVELAAEIDAATAELAPRHFRSLEAAVATFSRTALHRDLLLHDPLRRGLVGYNGRSLWLLRTTTTPPGVDQIDKKLAQGFADLLVPGMGDRRQVLQAVGTTIRADQLRGARDTLPGGWPAATRVGALTTATANQILTEPDQWPIEVVGAAVQHASTRLARLPGIAQIAADDHWFQPT
jgi:hypothetical protein